MSRGRRRDRRVFLANHPALFLLLAAVRVRPVLKVGGTLIVHDAAAVREALTRLPLDRAADGTIGGEARQVVPAGFLFDQDGAAHRCTRRAVGHDLAAAGLGQIRPVWTDLLEECAAAMSAGRSVDIAQLSARMAGATAGALLRLPVDPLELAHAAQRVASAAIRAQTAGLPARRRAHARAILAATRRLTELLRPSPLCAEPEGEGLAAMLAVAAVNTTTSGLPRAVAWCADEGLWSHASGSAGRAGLVDELLRVVAPIPLMLRIAAADGEVGGCRVRAGDRLLLVTRHAVGAHRHGPSPDRPAAAALTQLAFGAGSHACPGARLAKAQLDDTLRILAPLRPTVRSARPDRDAALPSWRELLVVAGGSR